MRICLLLALLAGGVAAPAAGQSRPVDLASVTLEDLMQIEITSASRRHETAEDVPAAVYVITQDDIRRSGMTSVPDLLRLVPGVQVGQINSNKWAISIRGFSGLYSNKLLVLVDGRTIYNPLFASVMWDTEDVMLEDVERIEIIRGPGAAVWGSTAVNGVINILTKSSTATRGLLVRGGAGTVDRGNLGLRYGGAAGAAGAYRVFAQFSANGDSVLPSGDLAGDHWRSVTTGFRGDWKSGPRSWLLEGTVSSGEQRPLWTNLDAAGRPGDDRSVSHSTLANVLGRWARTTASGDELQVQSFIDFVDRRESIGDYRRHALDVDGIFHSARVRRHNVVAGGGVRIVSETMDGGPGYRFDPRRARDPAPRVRAGRNRAAGAARTDARREARGRVG